MSVCNSCPELLPPENDYVSCGGCRGRFHYGCSGLREAVWRKYSAEIKAAWRCAICKAKTLADNDKNTVLSNSDIQSDAHSKNSSASKNTGSAPKTTEKTNEVSYLKELIRHKDVIIANQADLIDSLKEQIRLMKLNMIARPTAVLASKQDTSLAAEIQCCADPKSSKAATDKKEDSHHSNRRVKLTNKPSVVCERDGGAPTSSNNAVVSSYDMHEALARAKLHGVINLGKDANDDDQWRTVAHGRGRSRFVVGKKSDDGSCKLRVAELQSHWHVYRLHPATTREEVLDYLKTDFPDVAVEKLNSYNPLLYSSFKVSVREGDGHRVLDADLWPSGARIKRFFLPREKSS